MLLVTFAACLIQEATANKLLLGTCNKPYRQQLMQLLLETAEEDKENNSNNNARGTGM